ncbi:hypothetical protein BJX62DRAFT_243005 [Aspergillus germanicus]
MDNGKNVIVRIPHPIAGPKYYVTASEVATMEFARSVLDIPTPEVFAWNADDSNPVESEYVIMEEAPGVKLHDVWNDLDIKKKAAIVKLCADMDISRGPWKIPQDYVAAIGTREVKWLAKYAVPKPEDDPFAGLGTQNYHSGLIASHLWHTDLDAANIFIDPETNKISSIIDWQGISAAPLITQARHPKLVDYNGEHILEKPPSYDDLEPDEKRRVRDKWIQSIILYSYEQTLAKEVPLLYRLCSFPDVRTICETISFASNTWDDDDGIVPFRETLIPIEKYWGELGIDIPCPYHFTENELRVHREEGKG